MTAKSLNITSGPSKWDLVLAIFDRDDEDPREVMFLVEDWTANDRTVNLYITIPGIQQEKGSGEGWKFDGRICDGPDDVLKYHVKGSYDTKARKGKLELLGNGNPPETEVINTHGDTIFKKFGRIVSIQENGPGGRKVSLGDMVIGNGRAAYKAPDGVRGIVIDIKEPFTSGQTTDVIYVWFEGATCDLPVKFKDLKF